jgi:pheromone shutdown protein TraB
MEKYNLEEQNEDSLAYEMAKKRVEKIKSFYTHLLVYVIVNAFIIISMVNRSSVGFKMFFNWETFSTAFFWGIGVVAHAFSVFVPNFILGGQWEEKKIKEYMEKEKNEKWE